MQPKLLCQAGGSEERQAANDTRKQANQPKPAQAPRQQYLPRVSHRLSLGSTDKGTREKRVKRQGQAGEGGEQHASPSRNLLPFALCAFPISPYQACGYSIRSLSPPCHLCVTSLLILDLPQGREHIYVYTASLHCNTEVKENGKVLTERKQSK